MPYRRSRRGTYYRRRPQRPTTWIRNATVHARISATTQMGCVDLLAPLHTEDPLFRVGGQYDTAPSATGRTVIRVLGQIYLIWHKQDLGQWMYDDGAIVGICRGVWPYDSVGKIVTLPTDGSIHPWDPANGANTTDWAYWRHFHAFEDAFCTETSEVAGTGSDIIGIWPIDVKAKRNLKELGDTMILSIFPTGNATQGVERSEVTTSVLLR